MHIDELTKIAKHLTRSAVCGVTKEQLLRTFKKIYNLSDNEIKALLILCNFKSAPESIDYEYFYNNPLIKKAERINYKEEEEKERRRKKEERRKGKGEKEER